jgi:hypothetical protein
MIAGLNPAGLVRVEVEFVPGTRTAFRHSNAPSAATLIEPPLLRRHYRELNESSASNVRGRQMWKHFAATETLLIEQQRPPKECSERKRKLAQFAQSERGKQSKSATPMPAAAVRCQNVRCFIPNGGKMARHSE